MEMTGTTNPDRRAELWEMPDKRLFFMTPGTLKNDLAKGARRCRTCVQICCVRAGPGDWICDWPVRSTSRPSKGCS